MDNVISLNYCAYRMDAEKTFNAPLALRALRKRAGLSMRALARDLGYKGASSYQRYEDPDSQVPGALSPHLVDKLLHVLPGLGDPPITKEEVFRLGGHKHGNLYKYYGDPMQTPIVKVLGIAAAGNWLEIDAFEDKWPKESPITRDGGYSRARQYALQISGQSINKFLPDGAFAHCIAYDDIGSEPQSGAFYHIEQIRDHGELHEVTIKQFWLDNGKPQFWPYSTDAKFQSPIEIDPNSDIEVRIKGLVIGGYVKPPS